MAVPSLPTRGASDWYAYAQGMDNELRTGTRSKNLLARFASADQGIPATKTTDLPTVTWGTAATLARTIAPTAPELRRRGIQGTWDAVNTKLAINGGYSALDFYLTGTQVEIGFAEQIANGSLLWIFVDGQPITAAASLGTTTSGGTYYYVKLAFGSSARRRITVHANGINAWVGAFTDLTASVSPAPPLPRVAFVGDSFFGGSAAATFFQSASFQMGLTLGVDMADASYGGTGYVTGPELFGSAARVAKLTAKTPDLIVVSGSVNDDGATGVQAAATACFAAYRTALPDVKIIVFGPQPSAAATTVSTARAQSNAAVKAAAVAAPNVLTFIDMIGTASGTVPAAWAGFTVYNPGDLVTYAGSVWRWSSTAAGNTGPYNPTQYATWELVTFVSYGTGQVGTTTGDGNRDVLLYSDSVHPTPAGSSASATRQASEIRAALAAA